MQITTAQILAPAVEPPGAAAIPAKGPTAPARTSIASSVEITPATAPATPAQPIQRQTDVTLRHDSNGRSYYLVSDARSGQEIIEVPPKTVRDVGQGIQEYLKEEEAKAASRIDTKA